MRSHLGSKVALSIVALVMLASCSVPGTSLESPSPSASAEELPSESPAADVSASASPSDTTPAEVTYTRFFADDSPWNTRIDNATVDENSESMIELAKERLAAIERSGDLAPRLERRVIDEGLWINTESWTVPIVEGGVSTALVCRQLLCGDGNDVSSLPVPADVDPAPEYDGWFTIISGEYAYDLWRARREDNGSISYNFMRKWDLAGSGYSEPEVIGARGSGLPLIGGVIRPTELTTGSIEHALAIAVPGPAQRNFVSPASSTDGNGRPESLPEGARLRLKADVEFKNPVDSVTGEELVLTQEEQRLASALMSTLHRYGAIVVARSAVPSLYAERGETAAQIDGNLLGGLTLDDFEVITLGTVMQDPPLESVDQSGPQAQNTDQNSGGDE